METLTERTLSFGDFELDGAKRLLLKKGKPVSLNPKTFDLLLILVGNHGRVLSKNELLEMVWEGQFVEENNLSVQISTLRKIFGEKKGEHQFIATVPGKGYKFVHDLNEPGDDTIVIENHKIERVTINEEIENPKPLKAKPKKNVFAFALIGLLVAAGIGVWFFLNRGVNSAPIDSIAVMPFVYEGENAENEYLSDGMTESLINSLSQLPKLTVKARNSVFHYKGKEIEPQKIGAELNVQAVLLGRITERGEQFVLSLELVDAKTNNHLWGEQYTRRKSDLAVLQNDIARDVSAKLRQKLTNGEALPKGGTVNAEAYQLYLKGRYFWNKRTQENHLKAIDLFEQAIALDPNFALAYTGIGDVYTVQSFRMEDSEKIAKSRAAAFKALEIEPNLAEAYTILAKSEWESFNLAKAEEYFKRAFELNPNYASLRQWHAEFLARLAKREESVAEINRALELDPLSVIINSDATYIYMMAQQYDKALAQADKTIELDPNWLEVYFERAYINEYKGDFAQALSDYEKANETSKNSDAEKQKTRDALKEVRKAFEKDGAKGYWRKQLEIENKKPETTRDFYLLGIFFTILGEKENALDALEKSVDKKQKDIDLMKAEPAFDALQNEPRFQMLLRRVGLSGGKD